MRKTNKQDSRLRAGQVAILFTDLQGSSVLNNQIGDVLYQEKVLYPHFREMLAAAETQEGRQSGSPAGDSMMFIFAEVGNAIEAAVQIQEWMKNHPYTATDGTIAAVTTRIGIHYSKRQLTEDEDFGFNGNADCNYAARVMGIAQCGQILLSDEARSVAQTARTEWREWDNRLIKSFEETPCTVHELCWDGNISKGEPGAQFVPDWYVARNEYISRTEKEKEIVGLFNPKRPEAKFTRLVTLHGFGGMGKTRLAMQCAVQMVGVFEGRVKLVPLGRIAQTLEGEQNRCDFLAAAIGKVFGAPDDEPATAETLLRYVSTKRTLLLLDNWETVEGTLSAELVAMLLTNRQNLTLLVTGRQCVHVDDMEQEVAVEGLPQLEARSLFLSRLRQKEEYREWTPTPPEEAALTGILNSLAGHALAIELVAAGVPGRDLAEVAQELKARVMSENTRRREGHISGDNSPRHASLQASLDWSWDLLDEPVRYALCCVGLFAQPFTITDARKIFPQMTLEGILGLRDAALMQLASLSPPHYTLLRVTQEYAQEKRKALDATIGNEIESRFISHYAALMEQHWQGIYDHDLPTLIILDAIHTNASSAFFRAIERNDQDNANALYNTLNWYYLHRSRSTEKRILEETMLSFRRRVLPKGHPSIAQSLNNLALLNDSQGRYPEAEPLYNEALQIYRASLPDGHLLIATSLNNLAGLYDSQGRFAEAEPLYNEALQICRASLPDGHPLIATGLNNLALLYESQGRYPEAEPLYHEALQIRRASLPDGHPDIASSLNNLAALYESQGRYPEAEPLYNEALQIYRASLPDGHPDIANSLNNLAGLYQSQGRYTEAEPLYNEALQIYRASLPDGHPDIASSLNNLAALYYDQGRYTEAEPLYHEALQIRRACLPDGHPLIATSLNNLAELHRAQGRYTEAEPLFKEALQIRRASLPDGHPDIATSLNNLAMLYYGQGRLAEALPFMKEAMEIFRKSLGAEHPNTKTVAANYAFLLKQLRPA